MIAPVGDPSASMAWGGALAEGIVPDLDAAVTPVAHPLTIAVHALLGLLGPVAVYHGSALLGAAAIAFLAFAIFRLMRALVSELGSPALPVAALSAIAVLVVFLRPAVTEMALGESLDIPFAALVALSLALFIERHLRTPAPGGVPWLPLALLTVAGGLRPEAWALALALVAWAAVRGARGRALAGALGLAASAPLLWIALSLAFEGVLLHALDSESPETEFNSRGYLDIELTRPGLRGVLFATLGAVPVIAGVTVLAAALDTALRTRRANPTLVAGAAAILLLGSLLFMDLAGPTPYPRYGLTATLILAVIAVAGLAGLSSRGSALAALAGFIALLLVVTSGQITDTYDVAADRRQSRLEQGRLIDLVRDSRVSRAIDECPTVSVGGPDQDRVKIGRALVALHLGRDLSEVELHRFPRLSPGKSIFRRATSPRAGVYVSRGEWEFKSSCLEPTAGPVARARGART